MNNSKIKIFIDCPKSYYYPGEQLQASIHIDSLDTIDSNKMIIIAKGKEIIKAIQKNIPLELYEYDDDSEDEEEKESNELTNDFNKILANKDIKEDLQEEKLRNKEINESKVIFKYKKSMQITSNDKLSKGKYTFPFEIDIPENIPGSFLFLDRNIYVEIIYTIKVKLNNVNMKASLPLIIRQKGKSFNYPKDNEYTKTIGGCCFEKYKSKIKINTIDKYSLNGSNIKLNVVINNEKCGMQGSPINIEIYQKIILLPKNKLNRIKITRLVGKYKGKKRVMHKQNFNEDISLSMDENKYILENSSKTKFVKYFKQNNIIPFLSQSIKSDLLICEYEIYAETQFANWSSEELGVFKKLIIYPPEKGILSKDCENISKDFSNAIVNKKIFLNEDTVDNADEVKYKKEENYVDKNNIIDGNNIKKNKEDNKKKHKSKKEKMIHKIKKHRKNEDDKENQINNSNINNDDINQNFNINAYKYQINNDNIDKKNKINEDEVFNYSKKKKNKNKNIIKEKNSSNIKKNFNNNYLKGKLDNDF